LKCGLLALAGFSSSRSTGFVKAVSSFLLPFHFYLSPSGGSMARDVLLIPFRVLRSSPDAL
jgi:hypothetical protein